MSKQLLTGVTYVTSDGQSHSFVVLTCECCGYKMIQKVDSIQSDNFKIECGCPRCIHEHGHNGKLVLCDIGWYSEDILDKLFVIGQCVGDGGDIDACLLSCNRIFKSRKHS